MFPTVSNSEGGGGYVAGRRAVIVDEADFERARELVAAYGVAPTCVESGVPIGDDGRWYSDGTGELVPYRA
ncbi:MAG: hypothetical protein OEW65_11595, partial [Thermoleophilia bacterium]|nr:hypothetical protein [Thermoleophilia bacterium]